MNKILSIIFCFCLASSCKEFASEFPEHQYKTELAICATTSKSWEESCYCRKAVDQKFEICERWPEEANCKKECHSPRVVPVEEK